jgi:hypothetical protein
MSPTQFRQEPTFCWQPDGLAKLKSGPQILGNLLAKTPSWILITRADAFAPPTIPPIPGASLLCYFTKESAILAKHNIKSCDHRGHTPASAEGVAVWVSSDCSVMFGLESVVRRYLENAKIPALVENLPDNPRFEPAPYTLLPHTTHVSNGVLTEVHYYPDRWATIPPSQYSLHTDATLPTIPDAGFAIVDCRGDLIYKATTQVGDVTESESQAVEVATRLYEPPPPTPLVITTDSQATMQSRAKAIAATRPLKRQTAGFQHQRLRRDPRAGIIHLIKVESHMVSLCNDRADHHAKAQDPTLPDMTGMRYLPGALIPLYESKDPVVWHDQAALHAQGRIDRILTKRLMKAFGHAHCPGLALPLQGLNSLQTRRVAQLRCESLPVLQTLLKYASRKKRAHAFPQQLARCPLCHQGQESVQHLFDCTSLLEHRQALLNACQQLSLPPAVLAELHNSKVLASLAAGLTPVALQTAWTRTPRKDELRPLYMVVINAFIGLWAHRCSLHEEWRRLPPAAGDTHERQWIAFLRRRPQEQEPADNAPPSNPEVAMEEVATQIAGNQNPETLFESLDDSSDDDLR